MMSPSVSESRLKVCPGWDWKIVLNRNPYVTGTVPDSFRPVVNGTGASQLGRLLGFSTSHVTRWNFPVVVPPTSRIWFGRRALKVTSNPSYLRELVGEL